LHDAVRIGQTSIADAVVCRIELDDLHAGDERIEHVIAARDAQPGFLDAGPRAAVAELVAVAAREDPGCRGPAFRA
jgi:hypothetical protein